MARLCSSLLLSLIFLSATRADAALIAWDLELLLTDMGTEPVPGLFARDETWLARIVWDAEATVSKPNATRWEYRDLIASADFSRAGKEIHFDAASSFYNGGQMWDASSSHRFNGALLQAAVHGSSGGSHSRPRRRLSGTS